MVVLDLETGLNESLLQLENIMILSRKTLMDKTLENTLKTGMNTYCRLVMTKESSAMMRHIQETQVAYGG
jgi:hypothetical protein